MTFHGGNRVERQKNNKFQFHPYFELLQEHDPGFGQK